MMGPFVASIILYTVQTMTLHVASMYTGDTDVKTRSPFHGSCDHHMRAFVITLVFCRRFVHLWPDVLSDFLEDVDIT